MTGTGKDGQASLICKCNIIDIHTPWHQPSLWKVFSKNTVKGVWVWGKHKLPNVSSYSYLGIDFSCDGAWDVHIRKVLDSGKKKLNQLHSVISNRDINLSARRLLLLSVIRPSIEYGSEVWEGN